MGVTRHPYDVPGFGCGEVWVRDGIIVQHELVPSVVVGPAAAGTPAAAPTGGSGRPERTVATDRWHLRDDPVSILCRSAIDHLGGIETSYAGIPIDDAWATPLQRAFVEAARAIPWGEVVSYGELAVIAGRPGAARVAGTFCAENRFALIVPCHRVVAANGIGGYGAGGTALKTHLLALEGVRL